MKLFKCFVSLGTQKYNFILKANSKEEVKDKLHKEGYSILSIKEIEEVNDSKKIKFYFKAFKNGEEKTGTVLANDIFKVYFKLRNGLKYEIKELYSEEDKNASNKQKIDILKKLEDQYNIFVKINSKKTKTKVKEDKKIKKENNKNNESIKDYNNFFMKKKIKEIHSIIDEILILIQKFLDKKILKNLSFEEIDSLEENYNNIIKVKTSTNIIKLKQIGEKILIKLGKILVKEINYIEENQLTEKEKYLNDLKENLNKINKLLKQIGSKTKIKEKSRDIIYITKNIISNLKKIGKNTKKINKNDNILDKTSNSYTKTLLLIEKYKEKRSENLRNILKNFYIFLIPEIILLKFSSNKKIKEILDKKDNLSLRKEVINNNLKILKVKIEKNSLIILKLKKFFNFILIYIKNFLSNITKYAFFLIFIFSLIFITFNILNYYGFEKFNLNYNGLFYFISFSIFLFLLRFIEKKLIKGLKGFIISFLSIFMFIFLIVFGVVNF